MRDRLDIGLLPDPELAPVEWRLGEGLVGLGALAWYYIGPDLRRYIKIERM